MSTSTPSTSSCRGGSDEIEAHGARRTTPTPGIFPGRSEPSPPTHEFEKLFPCQAGVADQRSQETAAQFPMFRYRESAASRPNQDHVAAFHAIEGESDPRY